MNNNFKRGKIGNCLVFHDFEDEPYDLKGWFYYAIEWFQQNGLIPSKMGGVGKSRKTVTFKYGVKFLENNNFEGVSGIWMAALPPDVHIEMFDALFSVHFNLGIQGSTLVLCFDDDILKFSRESLEKLVKDISAYFRAKYGYAYQREFTKGPSFYPFGVIGGNAKLSDEEEDAITKWGIEYGGSKGSYHRGQLRDIYPMNLLSEAHLNHPILGTTLQKWIASSPDHGELKPLTDLLWEWWVPEPLIDSVREALRATGIVICI